LTVFYVVPYTACDRLGYVLAAFSVRFASRLGRGRRGGVAVSMHEEFGPAQEWEAMADEAVVEFARVGDGGALEYLINKYKNFVRAKARSYFLIGADREDIIQEGMIGLYKAVRDFRSEKLSSFRAFAELCVQRQIITAIKTATRQKHIPLNSYVSLNKPIYDDDSDRTLLDVISGTRVSDPEELVIHREEFGDIEEKMGELLSELEWKVLVSYLDGKSYQEIADDLGRHVKSIDNALQRVKRKMERYVAHRRLRLDEDDFSIR
jgi:RNA polymerase sporulation-specific sigma factor